MALSREELLDRIERNSHTVVARPFGWPITVNKIHAMQYGAILGIIGGLIYSESSVAAVSSLTITLLVTFGVSVKRITNLAESVLVDADSAVGTSDDPRVTLVVLTIQHKPHYFWIVLLPTALLTTVALSVV